MSRRDDYGRRKGRSKSLPFVKLEQWVMRCPAWRDLDPVARCLYLEIKIRFNGSNNGSIGFGCREAAEALGVGPDTASRAFKSLEAHGFVQVTTRSTFNQKRLTREWLLTELPDDRSEGAISSRDFMRWSADQVDVPVPARPRSGKVVPLRGRDAAA